MNMGTSKNKGKQTTTKPNVAMNANAGGSVNSSANVAEPTNAEKMAITPKGLRFLLVGLIVMVSGYILMIGGGSKDPAVFNYAMFDFRRLVAAPLVILLGVVIEIISIVKVFRK